MMESVGEVSCVWAHEDACAKEAKGEPCGWCPLLYVSVDVMQGARMVNGDLESVFYVAEVLSKFGWAGVEWEAFRPEDCAASDVVCHVFHELISISQGWVGRNMRWYSDTIKGSSCRNVLSGDSRCD